MGSARPARRFDALRAAGDEPSRSTFVEQAPSVRFRVPSEVYRRLPAPSRRPRGSTGRTTLPSLGFRAVRHMPGRRTRVKGEVPPLPRAASGVFDPHRGVHHRPSRRLAAPERPSASLLEAFSSRRSDVLSDVPALLAFSASDRTLLREAGGCGRLQGVDPGANTFGPPDPRGIRRVVASTRFIPRERSPPASWRRALVARAPRSRPDRSTSRPIRVVGSCGSKGSVRPSRGHRLVRDSSPCDRRGFVPTGAGGWLMVSPRGSCALQAARSTTNPLASGPAEDEPRPEPAVLR